MTIEIAEGTISRMREYPDQITLQVDGVDRKLALTALGAAKNEISASVRFPVRLLTGPFPTSTGAFLWLDAGGIPYATLKALPDIVARHLAKRGIRDAIIAAPTGGELFGSALQRTTRAVVLCAFPLPPNQSTQQARLPDSWFEKAAAWVSEGLPDHRSILAAVQSLQFRLTATDIEDFFREAYEAAPATCIMIHGDFQTSIRAVNGRFWESSLAFGAGGPGCSGEDLVAIFKQLVEIARNLAEDGMAYAFVSFEPLFQTFSHFRHFTEWASLGGEDEMQFIWDQYVFDGFPYQILSKGHIDRFPREPDGLSPVGENKYELSIGEPADWLIGPTAPSSMPYEGPWKDAHKHRLRPDVQDEARSLLAPLLLKRGEGWNIFSRTYRKGIRVSD